MIWALSKTLETTEREGVEREENKALAILQAWDDHMLSTAPHITGTHHHHYWLPPYTHPLCPGSAYNPPQYTYTHTEQILQVHLSIRTLRLRHFFLLWSRQEMTSSGILHNSVLPMLCHSFVSLFPHLNPTLWDELECRVWVWSHFGSKILWKHHFPDTK